MEHCRGWVVASTSRFQPAWGTQKVESNPLGLPGGEETSQKCKYLVEEGGNEGMW